MADGGRRSESDGAARSSAPDLPHVVVARSPARSAAKRRHPIIGGLLALRWLLLVPAVVLTGGLVGLYFQPPGLQVVMRFLDLQPGGGTTTPIAVPAPPPAAAAVPAPRVVVGLGKLVPAGEVVTVAPPFGAGDARIASLAVREGDRVAAGDVLAVLDNEPQLQAAVRAAEANVAGREAALAQTRSAIQASREEAAASLTRAAASAENAERELDRAASLRERGIITVSDFEQKRTVRDEAVGELERARATLSRYGDGDIDDQHDVVVAARNLDTARADLARATADLAKATVHAPMDATVLTIHVRPGEKPGQDGIMNLGDLETMTAEVEIYQTQIGAVTIGDPVEITAEALNRPLAGTVDAIALEVGRQTLIDATPAANTDARVVKVTVRLDPDSSALARRFTNLEVLARILVGDEP